MAVGKTVRARYKGDRLLELLEPVELEARKEVTVTILDLPRSGKPDAFEKAAGGWAGIVDVDTFLRRGAEARRIRRPRVVL